MVHPHPLLLASGKRENGGDSKASAQSLRKTGETEGTRSKEQGARKKEQGTRKKTNERTHTCTHKHT